MIDVSLLSAKGKALCKKHNVRYEQLLFMLLARSVDTDKVDLGDAYIAVTGEGVTWTKKYLKQKVDGITASPLMVRVCDELLLPPPAVVADGGKKSEAEGVKDLADKNVMLGELKILYGQASDMGDKLKITSQIAELQRMKKEEVKTEDDTIHYYLPLTCSECPLKQAFDEEKARKEKDEEESELSGKEEEDDDVQEKKRRGRKRKEVRE